MANVIEFIVVLILIILALILVVHAIRSPKNFLVAILIEIPFGLIENILYQITFYQIEIDISSKVKHMLGIEDKLNIQEKPDFNYSGVKENLNLNYSQHYIIISGNVTNKTLINLSNLYDEIEIQIIFWKETEIH